MRLFRGWAAGRGLVASEIDYVARTRDHRAHQAGDLSAVVVRFSRNRKRYERQGLLVEPAAPAAAERGPA